MFLYTDLIRIEEGEISNDDRSKMNDQIFQQMELEVGIVMGRVSIGVIMS